MKKATHVKTRFNPSFRKDFFDKIDEPEKAYWLGYLYNNARFDEDGYFYFTRNRKSDFDALVRFLTDVRLSTHLYKNQTVYTDDGPNYTYYIAIQCKEFTDGFYKYFPHGDAGKKQTDIYPNISPDMNRHFIRGLYDSLSSVIRTKDGDTKRIQIRINGSYGMLRKIRSILDEELEFKSYVAKASRYSRFDNMLVAQSSVKLPDFILYLYDGVKSYNTYKYEQLVALFDNLYG